LSEPFLFPPEMRYADIIYRASSELTDEHTGPVALVINWSNGRCPRICRLVAIGSSKKGLPS
jgi:hypothetical protein